MKTVAEMDAVAWSTIALAGVTAILAIVAFLQLIVSVRTEARRTLPIAIAHQAGPRAEFDTFRVYLTNEGEGAAFNVRFGVRLDDLEYLAGDGRGHRALIQRGTRFPETGTLPVKVSLAPYALRRGGPDVDSRAVFFARYEDSRGRTWETGNPADPIADFSIGRAPRFLGRYERRQAINRANADMTANNRILADLQAMQQRAE